MTRPPGNGTGNGKGHESLLSFPCAFPVKAMGPARPGFATVVEAIVRRHTDHLPPGAVRTRASRGGKYLAVTVTIQATSQAQLDAIYQDLTSSEDVLVAL